MKRLAFTILLCIASAYAQQGPQIPAPTAKGSESLQGKTVYVALFSAKQVASNAGQNISDTAHVDYWRKIRQKYGLVLTGSIRVDPFVYVAVYQSVANPLAWSKAMKIAREEPSVKKKRWNVQVFLWNTASCSACITFDLRHKYFIGLLKAGARFEELQNPDPMIRYESVTLVEGERKFAMRLAQDGELMAYGLFYEPGASTIRDCPTRVSVPYSAQDILRNPDLDTKCGASVRPGIEAGEMGRALKNHLQGMFIFRTGSLKRAELLQAADPAVRAKRFDADLSTWGLAEHH